MDQRLDHMLPVPVKLPYFRDAAELPGPLPTAVEIRDSSKSDLSPRRSAWGGGSGVCCIRGIYIVKYGPEVTENEGNALLFIENRMDISAPRLYAMYRDSPSGPLHLVMECIQGTDLESLWKSLSVEAKSSITAELQHIFIQIHSLSPPHDFIGGVCGGGIPDQVFQTSSPNPRINGPFRTAEEVSSALALASRHNWEENGRHGWVSGFLSRQLSAALKGYEVNFTHGDLNMRNILVERVPAKPESTDSSVQGEEAGERWSYRVRGIVDWESAGWYPAYWEYASTVARFQSASDWLESFTIIARQCQSYYAVKAGVISRDVESVSKSRSAKHRGLELSS
ncbi:hypothetical protein B0J13DRAFT_674215 [Dactylonectria estremocensis]|uniref:Aminoglycoside phosphotransferase domain-containing protein n=1 Tax=Dactylonectria estremocensis TaxID=1079267 RepID=A0A9P9EW62_9HYPO|nr:hypothetical protein B0J13DRAFT_674215 [Dactylonectria estremocensis]